MEVAELYTQITADGLGSDLHSFLTKNGSISLDDLLKWIHVQENGRHILDFLKGKFSKVALLEHHSNSFTFKMSKDQSSVGYVFGLLEDLKEQYSISEYSVIQTSLE